MRSNSASVLWILLWIFCALRASCSGPETNIICAGNLLPGKQWGSGRISVFWIAQLTRTVTCEMALTFVLLTPAFNLES